MTKPKDPRDLAIALLSRSICSVQVGAVLADKWGIFGWGWNSSGDGLGEHAEAACLRRGNRKRFPLSTLYVAAARLRNGKPVTARPCPACGAKLKKVGRVCWRDGTGLWRTD